jgi:ABC-type multidrug transport system ATPase subunit
MPHIAVEKLTKFFRAPNGGVMALNQVSLDVHRRTLVALIGENGAGKTTLMKILSGRLIANAGTVRVNGQLMDTTHSSWKSRVGFAEGEATSFYDRLSGRANLQFFASLYGLDGSTAARRIDSWIERLLLPQPDAPWQSLSSGGRSRWVLARALLHGPSVLLLDEPTRSQDPEGVRVVHAALQALRRSASTTIFLATHRREDLALADEVIWLKGGSVVCSLAPRELLANQAFNAWWAAAKKSQEHP